MLCPGDAKWCPFWRKLNRYLNQCWEYVRSLKSMLAISYCQYNSCLQWVTISDIHAGNKFRNVLSIPVEIQHCYQCLHCSMASMFHECTRLWWELSMLGPMKAQCYWGRRKHWARVTQTWSKKSLGGKIRLKEYRNGVAQAWDDTKQGGVYLHDSDVAGKVCRDLLDGTLVTVALFLHALTARSVREEEEGSVKQDVVIGWKNFAVLWLDEGGVVPPTVIGQVWLCES